MGILSVNVLLCSFPNCKYTKLNIFIAIWCKGEAIRATNCCNLQRNIVALQVEKRCCTYYHPPQNLLPLTTKFVVASWKNLLKKVDASSTWCNMLLQLATTKFCCATMFEVGGNTPNTCNNAFNLQRNDVACKLKKNVARITGPLRKVYLEKIHVQYVMIEWVL